MKEITVISGKGGTGKTSITAALASVGKNLVLCDGDVDAADLHLVVKPTTRDSFPFEGSWVASIHPDLCGNCWICSPRCRFDAISSKQNEVPSIDPLKCEGCRLCERLCPSSAISSARSIKNQWFISDTPLKRLQTGRSANRRRIFCARPSTSLTVRRQTGIMTSDCRNS